MCCEEKSCRKRDEKKRLTVRGNYQCKGPEIQVHLSVPGTIKWLKDLKQMNLERQRRRQLPSGIEGLWLFSEWHRKHRPVSDSSGSRARGQIETHSHILNPTSCPSHKLRGVCRSYTFYFRENRQRRVSHLGRSSLGPLGQRITGQGTQIAVDKGMR